MRNFKDAIPPSGKANKRIIGGTEQTIAFPTGWQDGTVINRDALMAMQGFDNVTTVFNPDGSISETNALGEVCKTEFLPDGSIRETFSASGQQMIHVTSFMPSGEIVEVVQ